MSLVNNFRLLRLITSVTPPNNLFGGFSSNRIQTTKIRLITKNSASKNASLLQNLRFKMATAKMTCRCTTQEDFIAIPIMKAQKCVGCMTLIGHTICGTLPRLKTAVLVEGKKRFNSAAISSTGESKRPVIYLRAATFLNKISKKTITTLLLICSTLLMAN